MKWCVTGPLGIAQLGDVRELVSVFDLRFVPNVGVSLGLLPADSEAMRWALVALTGAIAAGVAWWMTREKNRQDLIALGLVLGGALGNILDRIRFGYVVDYRRPAFRRVAPVFGLQCRRCGDYHRRAHPAGPRAVGARAAGSCGECLNA